MREGEGLEALPFFYIGGSRSFLLFFFFNARKPDALFGPASRPLDDVNKHPPERARDDEEEPGLGEN